MLVGRTGGVTGMIVGSGSTTVLVGLGVLCSWVGGPGRSTVTVGRGTSVDKTIGVFVGSGVSEGRCPVGLAVTLAPATEVPGTWLDVGRGRCVTTGRRVGISTMRVFVGLCVLVGRGGRDVFVA